MPKYSHPIIIKRAHGVWLKLDRHIGWTPLIEIEPTLSFDKAKEILGSLSGYGGRLVYHAIDAQP